MAAVSVLLRGGQRAVAMTGGEIVGADPCLYASHASGGGVVKSIEIYRYTGRPAYRFRLSGAVC